MDSSLKKGRGYLLWVGEEGFIVDFLFIWGVINQDGTF